MHSHTETQESEQLSVAGAVPKVCCVEILQFADSDESPWKLSVRRTHDIRRSSSNCHVKQQFHCTFILVQFDGFQKQQQNFSVRPIVGSRFVALAVTHGITGRSFLSQLNQQRIRLRARPIDLLWPKSL